MKAWHTATDFNDYYGAHLLVWAPTRNAAKKVSKEMGPWEYEHYLDIKVRRAPAYDGLRDGESVLDDNDDLPDEAPPFYGDEE